MKKFPILILLMITALFLITLSKSVNAANITSCGDISYSGNYEVMSNLTGHACINILPGVSDISLNLNGFVIKGTETDVLSMPITLTGTHSNITIFGGGILEGAHGAAAFGTGGDSALNNITLENITINTLGHGILFGSGSTSGIIYLKNVSIISVDSSAAESIYVSASTGSLNIFFINSRIFSMGNANLKAPRVLTGIFSFYFNNNHFNITSSQLSYITSALMNNSDKGNYYSTPSGTGYSQVCDDADVDGICDIQLNLSATAIDYLPIKNISLLTLFVAGDNISSIILPIIFNGSDYFNPLRCSDPFDSDYLFCDNFEYAGELSTNGWTYSDNNVWSNTSNLTYYPSTIVAYQGNSFKLNSSKGGIYHTFLASTDSSAVAGTEEIYEGGVLVKTITYSNPKLNVKKIKTSFYLKTNYTPGLTDGSGTFWGINENPITNDTSVDSNLYMYLDHTKNYIYYTAEVNGTKTLSFYTYNFTSESYYTWLSINPAPTTSVKVENTLFFENNTCWDYDTIYAGGTSYTSALRHAGYSRGDVSIYGEYLVDSPCTGFKSIYFRTTGQNNSNPGIFLIDQPEILITESTSNLNLRVFDCTSQSSFITLCDDYWMTNNCVNVSTSNVLPIAATVIVNNEIYTASSQGYVAINGISAGTYSVNITYGNVSNYIIAATNNTNAYRDVCFFSSGTATIPPGTDEFADKISAFLAKYGIVSSSSKLLLAIIVMIVGTLIIVFSLPAISFVIVILFNVLVIIAFTALGFIPIWAIVLIVVLALALILPKLMGGQG